MADNHGPMAWLFLPENEQVQYLQKIALRAEKPSGPHSNSEKDEKTKRTKNVGRAIIFCTKCIFSETYWRFHIFRPSLRY